MSDACTCGHHMSVHASHGDKSGPYLECQAAGCDCSAFRGRADDPATIDALTEQIGDLQRRAVTAAAPTDSDTEEQDVIYWKERALAAERRLTAETEQHDREREFDAEGQEDDSDLASVCYMMGYEAAKRGETRRYDEIEAEIGACARREVVEKIRGWRDTYHKIAFPITPSEWKALDSILADTPHNEKGSDDE